MLTSLDRDESRTFSCARAKILQVEYRKMTSHNSALFFITCCEWHEVCDCPTLGELLARLWKTEATPFEVTLVSWVVCRHLLWCHSYWSLSALLALTGHCRVVVHMSAALCSRTADPVSLYCNWWWWRLVTYWRVQRWQVTAALNSTHKNTAHHHCQSIFVICLVSNLEFCLVGTLTCRTRKLSSMQFRSFFIGCRQTLHGLPVYQHKSFVLSRTRSNFACT